MHQGIRTKSFSLRAVFNTRAFKAGYADGFAGEDMRTPQDLDKLTGKTKLTSTLNVHLIYEAARQFAVLHGAELGGPMIAPPGQRGRAMQLFNKARRARDIL